MVETAEYGDSWEMALAMADLVADCARQLSGENGGRKVRILDLATGGNQINPRIINLMSDAGVDFEFVFSDVSPTILKLGYERCLRELAPERCAKVRCVLADSNDLRRRIDPVVLYEAGGRRHVPIAEVLGDTRYEFLRGGYENGSRKETFEDETFDVITGVISYGSMQPGYFDAIGESARVLRKGGWHIALESEVERVRSRLLRTVCTVRRMISRSPAKWPKIVRDTLSALHDARPGHIEEVNRRLSMHMTPTRRMTWCGVWETNERNPDQIIQNGDVTRDTVLAHRKERAG